MPVIDLIDEQDEMSKHMWNEVVLWPRQWQRYQMVQPFNWQICRLVEVERQNIPDHSGIYTLVIQPKVFGHPACAYLMYVGKTISLRRRFTEYLNERNRETGRPKILRLLNKYPDHTWFCFTPISENEISQVEDDLISAYIPPCNDQFPASISRVINAF